MGKSKFLTVFETHEEYVAFKASDEYVEPNVSYCRQQLEVHFNGSTSPLPRTKWVEFGTTCNGFDLYAEEKEQVSKDGGITWKDTGNVKVGRLIEEDSIQCGYEPPVIPIYQWVTDGYMCNGVDKYWKEKKQVSYDNGRTWEDVVPEETQQGELIETNSVDCGYVPPVEPQYQWVVDGYTCNGVDKYQKKVKQISYDEGQTWENIVPEVTELGDLLEQNSTDCGYIPPIYEWREEGEIIDQGNKYHRNKKYVSYDNGETWEYTGIAVPGSLIEENVSPVDYESEYFTMRILTDGKISLYDEEDSHTGFHDPSGSYPIDTDAEWSHAENIMYSRDNGETWKEYHIDNSLEWTAAEVIEVEAGEKVLWKGTGQNFGYSFQSGDFEHAYSDEFYAGMPDFDAEGNIMSLIYGDNFAGRTSLRNHEYAFNHLFPETRIIHAHNLILPAENLSHACYEGMFRYCELLETAPELPAESLANYCYRHMFESCYSLTTAPELPSDETEYECYCEMFYQCSGMTTGPSEILASTIVSGACEAMFGECYSLVTAPEMNYVTEVQDFGCRFMFFMCHNLEVAPPVLGAPTVSRFAYYEMFDDCKKLEVAPVIMATGFPESEYEQGQFSRMFDGCSSLRYIKSGLITYQGCGTTGEYWHIADCSTQDWVRGVAANGTFVKNRRFTANFGDSWIPEGWTVEDAEF